MAQPFRSHPLFSAATLTFGAWTGSILAGCAPVSPGSAIQATATASPVPGPTGTPVATPTATPVPTSTPGTTPPRMATARELFFPTSASMSAVFRAINTSETVVTSEASGNSRCVKTEEATFTVEGWSDDLAVVRHATTLVATASETSGFGQCYFFPAGQPSTGSLSVLSDGSVLTPEGTFSATILTEAGAVIHREPNGTTMTARLDGQERLTVQAGTFNTLRLVLTLNQPGQPFSVTRWVAPGVGTVKQSSSIVVRATGTVATSSVEIELIRFTP
ncbi:MAG: hypothetical protein FJY99_06130 [Candidatus Sericytochromatia bacterium]|nr:hypothetical protein [Candidatus Tanganyikabacteria bacterium]